MSVCVAGKMSVSTGSVFELAKCGLCSKWMWLWVATVSPPVTISSRILVMMPACIYSVDVLDGSSSSVPWWDLVSAQRLRSGVVIDVMDGSMGMGVFGVEA